MHKHFIAKFFCVNFTAQNKKRQKMKKIAILLLVALSLGLSSCGKQKDTIVNVTVKDITGVKENFSVYMFDETTWSTIGNNKLFAKKTVVTDVSGIAKFILNDELDIIDDQTTFYFSVFYNKNGDPLTYTKFVGVTIEKGQTIAKELFLN